MLQIPKFRGYLWYSNIFTQEEVTMPTEYNLEDAVRLLPPAIENMSNFCSTTIPNTCTMMEDIAKQCGAPQLIKDVQYAVNCLTEFGNMLKDFIGEEGASVTEGTLYGTLAAARKLNTALGGEQ